MSTKTSKKTKNKMGRKEPLNRFYVGARHIAEAIEDGVNDEWTKDTLGEAVEHAKELLEEENKDLAIVVQIVRIVRRAKPPITVEVVK